MFSVRARNSRFDGGVLRADGVQVRDGFLHAVRAACQERLRHGRRRTWPVYLPTRRPGTSALFTLVYCVRRRRHCTLKIYYIYVHKVDAHTRLTHKALIFSGGRGYIGPTRPGPARPRAERRAGFKCVEALGRIIIRGPYPPSNAIIYMHLQLQ